MKLNRGMLLAVVMAVGALAITGCHKASDASSDDGSAAATQTSQADDQDTDGSESATMFASARRFGGGWRGERGHERRGLRRDIRHDRRDIGRDRRELRRDRPWR